MINSKSILASLSLLLTISVSARVNLDMQLGGDTDIGNGGDSCEEKILAIRNDLKSWIIAGGPDSLVLPAGMSVYKYSTEMIEAIDSSIISCTANAIHIGNAEKTCQNYKDQNEENKIECNFERFLKTSSEDQYKLIHHEFAGIAGIETNATTGNNYEESNYTISNQLSAFLVDVVIKKLAIKPASEKCVIRTVKGLKGFSAPLRDELETLLHNRGYKVIRGSYLHSTYNVPVGELEISPELMKRNAYIASIIGDLFSNMCDYDHLRKLVTCHYDLRIYKVIDKDRLDGVVLIDEDLEKKTSFFKSKDKIIKDFKKKVLSQLKEKIPHCED